MNLEHSTNQKSTKVVSPALLLSCFGICLGSAYLLIPKGDELYHMLLADGDQERVIELVVQELQPSGSEANGESTPKEEVDYNRLMSIAFDSVGSGSLSGNEVARITSVLERCDPTSESFKHLKNHAGDIGARENELFYNTLAKRALGEGDPKLAAEIYTDLASRTSKLSVGTVEMMVKSYRYNGQSKPAFACIEGLHKQLGGIDKLPNGLRDVYVELLMEVERPGEAFDILSKDFELAKGDTERVTELLPTLVAAANYSERGGELRPFYETYFAAVPESKFSLERLAEIGRGELDPKLVAFFDHAKQYAQICEWNNFFDSSFQYYLKCAALGDDFSLKRAIDLNEGLLRNNDLAELLQQIVPIQGQPEHTLKLAKLLGQDARYEEAISIYEDYIKSHPEETKPLIELAALYTEAGNLKDAIALYKEAVENDPESLDLKVRTAALHIAFGEHQAAFEIYRLLPDEIHTVETLERLLMLAEAHGDYEELNRAHQLRFAALSKPRAEDYLDLAQSHSLKGDLVTELQVLHGAMINLPESEQIAVAYADVLYRESRFDEAMSLLTRRDLRDNMQAMSMFIEICGGTDNHSYAAKYLSPGIEEKFAFAPSVRIELGQIYEETGNLGGAQKLYASVPEGGMAWQLLATAKYKTGEYDRAEEYQRRYLKAAEQPDAQDWVFLGDICKNLGKEREATEAYKHSLSILKSDLKPQNASL